MEFPTRINKYLAETYNITRGKADALVEAGKVRVNGKVVKLGTKVEKDDKVEIAQGLVDKIVENNVYYAYNKPEGVVTHSAGKDEIDIKASLLKSLPFYISKHLFPVGRLDKKSTGLLILTNDGKITEKLLSPEYEHDKEYVVTTIQKLPNFFQKHMEAGMQIGKGKDGYKTKPAKVNIMGEKTFSITLTEGKRHQIRRMCEALRLDVQTLKRTRVMNIHLGNLKPNTVRKIEGKELDMFLNNLRKNK